MTGRVLALNAGSSTLKFSGYVFEGEQAREVVARTFKVSDGNDGDLLERVLESVHNAWHAAPSCVGHRIVHGGAHFDGPVLVTADVRQQLSALEELAPLHLPPALALLDRARERLPDCAHVACFDTAFHRQLPDVARRYALPNELHQRGVMRYGFHGLSCESVLSVLGSPAPERLIVAHLGSGASLTAILAGRSIDTSMGLTPAGGIPMGTRSGDLDPGVLIHLIRQQGFSAQALEQLVNHDSGLQALGGNSDMSELLRLASSGDVRAQAAIESFAYAIKKQLGAYIAVLGGLDCLVFTGGIGEHAPLVRELAVGGLAALGLELDPAANAVNAALISQPQARTSIRVIPADEALVIARATLKAAAG